MLLKYENYFQKEKMAIRFGSGEYEAIDVDVRNSTLEARGIFFNKLYQQKGFWLKDLLALYNEKLIPEEFLQSSDNDLLIRIFLPFLFSKSPHAQQIDSSNTDTPLIKFCWYFLDKQDEINRLEEESNLIAEPIRCRIESIKQIVPNWKTLKSESDAVELCNSIEIWAKKWNLTDDWCLDFALDILCNFKAYADVEIKRFEESNGQQFNYFMYKMAIKEVMNETLQSYTNKLGRTGFDDIGLFSPFKYKWKDFQITLESWCPSLESESIFKEIIRKEINQAFNELEEEMTSWSFEGQKQLAHIIERERKGLERHCDLINQKVKQDGSENEKHIFTFRGITKVNWIPSKENRDDFINRTLIELEKEIIKKNNIAKSLKSFTKGNFNKKLQEYIAEIHKSIPANWNKVPKKYNENEHFEWLIEYQLTLNKSYGEIAQDYEVDSKTVRDGVKGLAKILGLTIRSGKKAGRPKGSKDSEDSPRQRNW